MNMARQPRNLSIECYRVLLMLGICLLHSITQGPYNKDWFIFGVAGPSKLLATCVNGFVFISGWYGIRTNFQKIAKLYLVALACGLVFAPIALCFGLWTPSDLLVKILRWGTTQWFLSAYVVLMLVAPVINYFVETAPRKILLPGLCALGALGLWSFGTDVPFVGRLVPNTPGLGAYSALSLIMTYTLARVCAVHLWDILTQRRFVILFFASILCVMFGLGRYSSPFSIIVAGGIFVLFERVIWVPNWCGRLATLLAPSMFSVYLLHSDGHDGFALITKFEQFLTGGGVNHYLACVLTAVVVFACCVLLDVPRRFVVWLMQKRSR